MATTVDGFIGRDSEHLSLDWTSPEDKKLFVQLTKEVGAMIMGRKTFDTIGRPLPGRLIKVMTRTPEKFESIEGQVEYTSDSPEKIVAELKERGFAGCVIAGGAQVNTMCVQAGVIDEMVLTVEPKLFGQGVGLFEGVQLDQNMELLSSEMLNENTIKLHYRFV